MTADPAEETVGFGKPPRATRFRKGQSGNPRGRPRNRRREIPYEGILGQMVTIREDGRQQRVTAAEAFLLQLTQKGLAGDSAAARSSLEAIEAARAAGRGAAAEELRIVTINFVGMAIENVLRDLGLCKKKYPYDEHRVRWELNPWIVEAALGRLGERRLSEAEQREVWKNTRTPHKVAWPTWWVVKQ